MDSRHLSIYSTDEIIYSHTVDVPPYAKHQLHSHERYEIYCVFSGSGYYITEGNRHKLQYGKLFLMQPGEFHKPMLNDSGLYDRLSVHFDASYIKQIDDEGYLLNPFIDRSIGQNNVYAKNVIATTNIYDIFKEMDRISEDVPYFNTKFKILFISLLKEINDLFDRKEFDRTGDFDSNTFRIIEYINKNIANIESVDELCRKFYISRSQLNRNFNSLTGTSVWKYITNKRFILLKQYVSNGMQLGEAVQAVGFGNYSSFYRAYIKSFNEKPSDFQGL